MDFVQKKVTGQQGMTGRRGPRGPLSWILASVPESGVKGQLARPFPMQVAGPCMALQTWGKLTTRPDVSGHFTDPQGMGTPTGDKDLLSRLAGLVSSRLDSVPLMWRALLQHR